MAHKWWHRGKKSKKKGEFPLSKKEQYEIGQKSKSASVRKATKAGAVREGVIPKKTVKTKKGGDFPVYAKKSKKAGSFRSARKAGCKGEGGTFSWDGRSYSCATAEGNKKRKAASLKKEKAANLKRKLSKIQSDALKIPNDRPT